MRELLVYVLQAGREALLELGITKEIDAVMNALERHKQSNEEKEEERKDNDVDESKDNVIEEYKEESPALVDAVKTEV